MPARKPSVPAPDPNAAAPLRQRVLDAAVASLIEQGSARTTTLAVQRRAGVSRGALLHHFPTHAALLSATVAELVRRNEATVQQTVASLPATQDPVEQAVRALAAMTAQPPFLAELELWAVARVDGELRQALAAAERSARQDSERVLRALFAPVSGRPGFETVVALTAEFLRGLALSGVLRRSPPRRQQLVAQWVRSARLLLDHATP